MKLLVLNFFVFISFSIYSQITLTSNPTAGMNEAPYIDVCQCDMVSFALEGDVENITFLEWQNDGENVPGLENISLSFCEEGVHVIQANYLLDGTDTLTEMAYVRVSTTPDFSEILSMPNYTCQGQSIEFIGGFVDENNYTGFEMMPNGLGNNQEAISQVDDGVIPDNAVPCFSNVLTVNGGSNTITSGEEIASLLINLDHTYVADLVVTITCPNGSSVITHDNGGGGSNLGNEGLGFDYLFEDNSDLELWQNVGGATIPAGSYQSLESFDNFIGCPVSGDWTLEICDQASVDVGTVFYWGINFAMNDTTVFSPTPTNAYWEENEWVTNENEAGITIFQEIPQDTYTFVVEDNFGCTYSQDITLDVNESIDLNLVNQVDLDCSGQQIAVEEDAVNNCSQSNGSYEYCYGNDETQNWLYCPDVEGDGTMMSVEFTGGYLEANFDYIYIYDGTTTDSPLLATLNGEIENVTYTATNASGCLLVQLVTDYSINCIGNNYDIIQYTVSCGDANNYSWNWQPEQYLVSNTSPTFEIAEITGDVMVFTATITDPNNLGCEMIHDVFVNTENMFDVGDDATAEICITDQGVSLFNYLNGTPSGEGLWLNEDDEPVNGFFTPEAIGVYNFYYTSENCSASALLEVTVSEVPEAPTIIVDGDFMITGIYEAYQWYLDGVQLEGVTTQSYTAPIDGIYTVEVWNSAGCSAISDEVMIGEESTDNINENQIIKFNIYPNPFRQTTQLLLSNNTAEYAVSIFSLTGQKVREYNHVQRELIIQKGDLEAGIYLIEVKDEKTGYSRKQRLVVE